MAHPRDTRPPCEVIQIRSAWSMIKTNSTMRPATRYAYLISHFIPMIEEMEPGDVRRALLLNANREVERLRPKIMGDQSDPPLRPRQA